MNVLIGLTDAKKYDTITSSLKRGVEFYEESG